MCNNQRSYTAKSLTVKAISTEKFVLISYLNNFQAFY